MSVKKLFTYPTFNLELFVKELIVCITVTTQAKTGENLVFGAELYELPHPLSATMFDEMLESVLDDAMVADITAAVSVYQTMTYNEAIAYIKNTLGDSVEIHENV